MSVNDFINPTLASTNSYYSYFHEYLVDTIISDLMEQYDMSYEDAERMVYTKGLKIYSTVDSTAQKVIVKEFKEGSYIPSISGMYNRDSNNNILNNDGQVVLRDFDNDFDKNGNFRLKGEDGDVQINSDGSVTINSGHRLNVYETETSEGTDYSLEFKNYYVIENGILYSIAGGFVNIPMAYKSCDVTGHVVISADFFSDPNYEGFLKIDGDDVIITEKAYTLSTKTRQPQAAMTIVGVGTGEVKAMVGGRQFGGQKLLNRTLNPRQPGSSIKPLAVYGAALQKSYEL
jgi:penicillin-binding protein 1A